MSKRNLFNFIVDRFTSTPPSTRQEEGSPNPRAIESQVSSPSITLTHHEGQKLPFLPNEIWELIFSILSPKFICEVVSLVSKSWNKICNSNVVWKNQCMKLFGDDIGLEPILTNWKQQFQYCSEDVWDPKNKFQSIQLEKNNKTAVGKYEAWRTVIGKLSHRKGKRVWQISVEETTYIIGLGICHSKANISVDLSGSSPALSYFSNGYTYSYPNTVRSSLESTKTHKTQTFGKGDVITIALDLDRGICSFFRNQTKVVYFVLRPFKLCSETAWHVGATLSNGSKVTLKPILDPSNFFSPTERLCPLTQSIAQYVHFHKESSCVWKDFEPAIKVNCGPHERCRTCQIEHPDDLWTCCGTCNEHDTIHL